MRPTLLIIAAVAVVGAHASWFGSDSTDYTTWSKSDLTRWLEEHNVPIPESAKSSKTQLQDLVKTNWNTASAWTYDQYAAAQQSFQDLRDSTFDAWDESRLREFLLEQGVVAPSGPREQLVLLAKQKYRAYTNAASSFSSRASATASTAIYGDSQYQASQSLSSIVAQATNDVQQTLDDSKDYVYSTWDDNQLRTYLEDKGVIKTKSQKKREELLALMRDSYAKVTNPVWEAWGTSYIHSWLVNHGLIKSDFQKNRDALTAKMAYYYYSTTDTAYSTWSDSQLKDWLVQHNVIKSDAQLKRDKLVKLVQDNYSNAQDTIWSAWSDNQIKDWLVEHGYMRSNAQVKRDELIKSINEKYTAASARSAAYLTWPDARLRAYLRERGLPEDALPTSRPGLLRECFANALHSIAPCANISVRGNSHSMGPDYYSRRESL
ncbi:hypothetical protein HGRIS_006680 [Hohenbuehelia grisea]|uniref:Uncharacterized protein n=1 Tax=Hohenbuehelia grisea TaxID=104357 RepID=A0ABR3JB85_9AGAR